MQHIWTQSSWCRDFQDHQPHHDVTKVNSQRTRLWTCSLKGRPMLNEAIYPNISKCIIITIVSNNYHQIIQIYHYPLVWSSQRLSSVFNQHLWKGPGKILNSLLLTILLFLPTHPPDNDKNGKKVCFVWNIYFLYKSHMSTIYQHRYFFNGSLIIDSSFNSASLIKSFDFRCQHVCLILYARKMFW